MKNLMLIIIGSLLFSGCGSQQKEEAKEVSFNNNKVKMLYFGATWCGPCRAMKTLFKDKDVKKELGKYNFAMYDVDKDQGEALKYRIEGIPTMIFLKEEDGAVTNLGRYVGGMTKTKLLRTLRNYNTK